jgi:hypothetical protein
LSCASKEINPLYSLDKFLLDYAPQPRSDLVSGRFVMDKMMRLSFITPGDEHQTSVVSTSLAVDEEAWMPQTTSAQQYEHLYSDPQT